MVKEGVPYDICPHCGRTVPVGLSDSHMKEYHLPSEEQEREKAKRVRQIVNEIFSDIKNEGV